jgi:TolB protein
MIKITQIVLIAAITIGGIAGCKQSSKVEKPQEETAVAVDTITYPQEKHLKNMRQLTFGGDNAEAYFSFNSEMIVFQRRDNKEVPCDQIYYGKIPTDNSRFEYKLLSTGKGTNYLFLFFTGK